MNRSRRQFSRSALSLAIMSAVVMPLSVNSQTSAQAPGAAAQVREIKPARKTDDPKKIEVIEFFWYACPHCNALEPNVQEWSKRLGADVSFRKVHVDFQEINHQKLFYTLEAMGKEKELSPKVFYRIHGERDRLDTPEKIATFMATLGVDKKQFLDTFNSFGVKNSMTRATNTMKSFGVDGVPAFAINGKYYTSPSMAGSNEGVIKLIDKLILQERALLK